MKREALLDNNEVLRRRVEEVAGDSLCGLPAMSEPVAIGVTLPHLKGKYFYCKGTNRRMRDLAGWPMDNGFVIRICDNCAHY